MSEIKCPKIINPKKLDRGKISGEVVEIGGEFDYKPNIGILPDGELLLFNLHQHVEDKEHGASHCMHSVLYRSVDDGKTWSRGKHMPFEGHEPSVTIMEDGTVFILTLMLPQEPFNYEGYCYVNVYRSTDRGNTWIKNSIKHETFPEDVDGVLAYSRNLLKLDDGSIILGVTAELKDFIFKSTDNGITWNIERIRFEGMDLKTKKYPWGFMAEALFFKSPSGRLMLLARVDLGGIVFDDSIPYIYKMDDSKGIDVYDSLILMESIDCGSTWRVLRGVGFPAMMYPGVVTLSQDKMLLNYTVRAIPPEDSKCLHPHMGVQATIIRENSDGSFEINLDQDLIIIDDKTDENALQGGGFGRTVMLKDGTLITPYSYKWADEDVIKAVGEKKYLDQVSFNELNKSLDLDCTYEKFNLNEETLKSVYVDVFCVLMKKAKFKSEVLRWKIGN